MAIVGANGSGKTQILKAFAFLRIFMFVSMHKKYNHGRNLRVWLSAIKTLSLLELDLIQVILAHPLIQHLITQVDKIFSLVLIDDWRLL